jgi:meso-butanediol dehydrogenase/(S,S)-butanediol dehydrogenase/diacetyl reductase
MRREQNVAQKTIAAGRRYEGKVAIVTGAASGIGLAIVRRVAAEGGRVAAGDVNVESLDRLQQELGDAVTVLRADVTREGDLEALVDTAVDRFGRVDASFSAAGIVGSAAPVWELTEQDWDKTINVCLKGCFFAVKHVARRLIQQGEGGAIVNIASLMSQVPVWGVSHYTVAKAGIEMLTKNAALELGEHRIRVTTVSPGLIATPMTEPGLQIPGVLDGYLERIPMGRVGTPDDIASAAAFLASDEASYLSGANIFVDGAWAVTGHPDFRPQ